MATAISANKAELLAIADSVAKEKLIDKAGHNVALDGAGDHVYLAPSMVNLRLTQERFPNIRFLETREIA